MGAGRSMRIVIVTGVSGAGKSTALRALEDVGYFCVDNLPLPLHRAASSSCSPHAGRDGAGGAGASTRARASSCRRHREVFGALRKEGHQLEVLFLDADDDVLVRRFSETRRRHPLSGDDLREGIAREREILRPLREDATALVDTGNLNVHQLKGVIQERYRALGGRAGGDAAVVRVQARPAGRGRHGARRALPAQPLLRGGALGGDGGGVAASASSSSTTTTPGSSWTSPSPCSSSCCRARSARARHT